MLFFEHKSYYRNYIKPIITWAILCLLFLLPNVSYPIQSEASILRVPFVDVRRLEEAPKMFYDKDKARLESDALNLFLFVVFAGLKEDLRDSDWWVQNPSAMAIAEIAKTKPELITQEIETGLKEALRDSDWHVPNSSDIAIAKIAKTRPEFTREIVRALKDLRDFDWRVRNSSAIAIAKAFKTMDLSRCYLYRDLVQEKVSHAINEEDMNFIFASISDVIFLEEGAVTNEASAVDFVAKERYPIYEEAKRTLVQINKSLGEDERYDEGLFWKKYYFSFNRLINIDPDLGMKFFLYYVSLKGEDMSGPQRMAYLFDDLENIFNNAETVTSISTVLSRMSKRKIDSSKVLDIFRLIQGCFLLGKREILEDVAGKNITSFDVLVKEVGGKLLIDLADKLEIEDIQSDEKTLKNWLRYEKPWHAIIAFKTFYKRFEQHGLDTELNLIKEMAYHVLKGSYSEYRYDTDQLKILTDDQKEKWRKNNITIGGESDIEEDVKLKPARIKDKIKDMIEHQHIKDIFILSSLRDMLNEPEDGIESLSDIIKDAGQNIGKKDIKSLQRIKYFKDIPDFETASLMLSKLCIIREMLILFNLTGQEIQNAQVNIKKQGEKVSIEKFILNLNNKLNKLDELSASADVTDILDNIIRSKSGYSTKSKITIEDTDDPFVLISIGEKPVSTCQGYNYPSVEYFRCLPSYLGDSNKKVIVVRKDVTIIARAIIRIMKTKDNKPVIFLEKIYSSTGRDFKKDILNHLLSKAISMNLSIATKLDVGGIDAKLSTISSLTSTGTRNTYEYSDAKAGKQSGAWNITSSINPMTPSAPLTPKLYERLKANRKEL